MVSDDLDRLGHALMPQDPRVAAWARAALGPAKAVAADVEMRARWLRHGGTWFVGVDALPNADDGAIGGVALAGPWEGEVPAMKLHRAQLSVVYPGYPRRDQVESAAAHAFRRERDAAHLDGLLAEGPDKRRFLREPHGWILGLPLTATEASPLVVWEGSHEIIRDAFMAAFAGVPPADWAATDVTEIYKDARDEVFEMCNRVELPMVPGQSVLMHRMLIHGVAPWKPGAKAPPEGRMVAYFRPVLRDMRDWLRLD